MTEPNATHWDPTTGQVEPDELPNAEVEDAAMREAAVDELLWLITKAGPFDSPRARAENLLDQIGPTPNTYGGTSSGAAFAYLDTLARAQRAVKAGLAEGTHCPCCGQRCQEYHRALNSGMAAALVVLTAKSMPGEWVHKPTVLRGLGAGARDESLLRFWGLLEDSLEVRDDGGKTGWWRVTPAGRRFVEDPSSTVPKYVSVYNGVSHGLDGPPITIVDALGHKFSLAELLQGV